MIESTCYKCRGTGEYLGSTCHRCGGIGKHTPNRWYTMTLGYVENIYSILYPGNVFRSYQVLECLDETEYDALSDSNKASLQFLLQCSMVDLNDGKAGRVRLWNWFGAESITVAALQALIDG